MSMRLRALADEYIRRLERETLASCCNADLFFHWLRGLTAFSLETADTTTTTSSVDLCYFKSFFDRETGMLTMQLSWLGKSAQIRYYVYGHRYLSYRNTSIFQPELNSMVAKLLVAVGAEE